MKKGDFVKIWLQQGIQVEGIVHRVKKTRLILRSVENDGKLVINNPKINIIMWRKIHHVSQPTQQAPIIPQDLVKPGQCWSHSILGNWEVVDSLPYDTVSLMNKQRNSEIINLSLSEMVNSGEWRLIQDVEKPVMEYSNNESDLENLEPYVPDLSLRAIKLSELKQIQADEIKKKVEKKINEFSPKLNIIQKVKDVYESPDFAKQLPVFDSGEKIS